MIEEHVKIHDQFSLEFKLGFTSNKKQEVNDFSVNMWIFIPNSLDINKYTYSKVDFYRDVKSNIRLITPIYLLRDIAKKEELPFSLLEESFHRVASNPTKTNILEYEGHIKMFQSIMKSSLRDEILHIKNSQSTEDKVFMINTFIKNCRNVSSLYRSLKYIINVPTIEKKIFDFFLFGDEFMSNLIEMNTFKILKDIDNNDQSDFKEEKKILLDLIKDEISYKKNKGYAIINKDDEEKNKDVVSRFSYLKKYIESQLFLKIKKKEDGAAVKQFYYSLAAGISMIFATIITFAFQIKYGNFTLPLFIALVVGYMLKDRIKELSRYYFSYKLNSKYFDNKIEIKINNEESIGLYKESQTFVKEHNLPPEVIRLRSRIALLNAENRINDEKIILYRTRMELNQKNINTSNHYPISGVNNIIRFNISQFIQKMDNVDVPLYVTDQENGYKIILGEKVYYLNLIIRFQHLDQSEYKRYRVMFNRNGIKKIERI